MVAFIAILGRAPEKKRGGAYFRAALGARLSPAAFTPWRLRGGVRFKPSLAKFGCCPEILPHQKNAMPAFHLPARGGFR